MSQPQSSSTKANPPMGAPGDLSSDAKHGRVDVEHLAPLYRQMFLIRRLEEEAARAYAEGKIGGFLHLYIGQESVAVGAVAALKPEDYVVTTYRDHGIAL